jgi:GNAT superfamily N-acetyltransferase
MNEPGVAPKGRGDIARPVWGTRFYEPGDETRIIAMLERAFDVWPRDEINVSHEDHLRWKLESHPNAAWQCIVAETPERVVGFQGYWLIEVKVDDAVLLARVGVDFAVDPDYQRLGVKVAMRDRAQVDNPRRVFDVHFEPDSGHPAFLHMRRKRGKAAQPRLAHRVEARVLQIERSARPASGANEWTVREVSSFDERADGLWDAASVPFRAAVVRKAGYLNWRYADERGGRYTVRVAEQDGKLLGYLVTRISNGRGFITDMLVLPDRMDVLRSLVAQSLGGLQEQGAREVECWLPEHHPYWAGLSHFPFDRKRRSIDYKLTSNSLTPERLQIPFADDPRAPLHITIGDSDVG